MTNKGGIFMPIDGQEVSLCGDDMVHIVFRSPRLRIEAIQVILK
jgi:hypothetical protein